MFYAPGVSNEQIGGKARSEYPYILDRAPGLHGYIIQWVGQAEREGHQHGTRRDDRAALRAAPRLLPIGLDGGTDFTVAMRMSGHRTRSTFDRYNIVSTEDLRSALARTAAYVESLPTKRNVAAIAAGDEHGQRTRTVRGVRWGPGLQGSTTCGGGVAEAGGNRTMRSPTTPGQTRQRRHK